MNVNRRKWNSMDQLEDVGLDNESVLLSRASNLLSLKHLSVSTPGMSTPDVNCDKGRSMEEVIEFPRQEEIEFVKVDRKVKSSIPAVQPIVPVTNKARQKKFDRQFNINETVLEYYSCALALDILLHGILYVTHNNFAFYSNVFGRVTKVLIPVSSIEKIQRSKTALIIPNAIHVHTNSEKYVFASFMSRENAYTQMQRVWTSLVSKSCGSKMHIVEPQLSLGDEIETGGKKGKRIKNSGTFIEHSGEKAMKDIRTSRKSVMFIEEPHEILFTNEEKELVSSVYQQVEDDESIHSEDEQMELSTVLEEVAAKNSEESKAPRSSSESFLRNSTHFKADVRLLRLCYALTLLLSLSAINLYCRIDAIIQQDISGVYHDQNVLLDGQRWYHASRSHDFLQQVNETLKRLNTVHKVLEKHIQLVSDQNTVVIPALPTAQAVDAA